MNQWTDHNWNRASELSYKCQLSALYHRKRERFYSSLDKFSNAFALIAGSAAFSDILPSPEAKAWAGVVVVLVTLPSLVFGWPDKSRAHALLASKFVREEAEMVLMGAMSADQLDKVEARLLSTEAEEPPALSALTRQCQNEIAIARGQKNHVRKLSWIESMFCHIFDMPAGH